jgi:hypothetical protein
VCLGRSRKEAGGRGIPSPKPVFDQRLCLPSPLLSVCWLGFEEDYCVMISALKALLSRETDMTC